MTRILVVGGAGAFGARLTRRLSGIDTIDLAIAGRNADRLQQAAQAFCADQAVRGVQSQPPQTVVLDSCSVTADQLDHIGADIVINASGPFQDQNYRLAEAAIASQSHYIDIADARRFVVGIDRLDQKARDAGVSVISGASTVPGISSTVLSHLATGFRNVDSVAIGISPGNHFDPGVATTQSVLKGLGKPIATRKQGRSTTCYGWQNLRRKSLGPIGKRWFSNVDVPDLELIPHHYPNIKTVSFQAGTELSIQHLGLWGLSWLSRARLIQKPDRLAEPLLKLKRLTKSFGSDCGGMFVTVGGRTSSGVHIEKRWTLVARDGEGPFIPVLASVCLAKALANGEFTVRGAHPCFNLVSYGAISDEIADLSITCTIDQAVR